MKKKFPLIGFIFLILNPASYCQSNLGRICDADGTCVFELKKSDNLHLKSDVYVEDQIKTFTAKSSPCEVKAWCSGGSGNKNYRTLISYHKPFEIRRSDNNQTMIRFQYVNTTNDFAVEAFDDVIFVDHEFGVYITNPDENCHGLPTAPTQYRICRFCGKKYLTQTFYNSFTKKGITIFIHLHDCSSSSNGEHDGIISKGPVPSCPKLDCDQYTVDGDINK